MDKNQRLKSIINLLEVKKVVNIKELMKRLGVTEMTIRRDLSILKDDMIVDLIPGGAILKSYTDSEEVYENYLITHAETKRIREKARIGHKAASLIEPNDTVAIDVGSTTEYVAKFIHEDMPILILCYGLNILVEIYRKKNCSPIFAGGYFHDDSMMFESREGIDLIKRIRADKAFISAAGVHSNFGVTTVNNYEIDAKQAVLRSSKTKILITDSTKFGKTRMAYFAELQDFDMIITDSEISEEYRSIIGELGIELVVV